MSFFSLSKEISISTFFSRILIFSRSFEGSILMLYCSNAFSFSLWSFFIFFMRSLTSELYFFLWSFNSLIVVDLVCI